MMQFSVANMPYLQALCTIVIAKKYILCDDISF